MIDYTIFYKSQMPRNGEWEVEHWDLFISAYKPSDRVLRVYKLVPAHAKHWLILPEYHLKEDDYPEEMWFAVNENCDEAEYIRTYFQKAAIDLHNLERICIDITGFIKPYLAFLLRWLFLKGVQHIDCIYAEPKYYIDREETEFSYEITEERQILGFEGIPNNLDVNNDILIIGVGYDDRLVAKVAESRNNARKVQIYGLPSLSPQMYQENLLRASRASEAVGQGILNIYYAPANNPFVNADLLQRIIREEERKNPITNLYLCPLATMAQALGFILYYLKECIDRPVSIIYPFCNVYPLRTGIGIQRIWKYSVELSPR